MIHGGQVLIDSGLDELHEGFALALIPRHLVPAREPLASLDGCLGVRERPDAWHAVLRLTPDEARAAVRARLGVEVVCRPIPLEDMFVELAGGQQ